MKKTVAALALGAILLPAAVFAGSPHGGHSAEDRAQRMAEELQLTDQQREEIQQIMQEQRTQRRAMHEQTQERISNVLTPEQQEQWQQYREERRKRRAEHFENRPKHGHRYGG